MLDKKLNDDSTIKNVVEINSKKVGVREITFKFSNVMLIVVRQRQAKQTNKFF